MTKHNGESMDDVVVHEEAPSTDEYQRLRALVGWTMPESSAVAPSLRKSLFCVCARSQGNIVGMARIIGDGALVFYVQDVIVDPARQGQGIGKRLMDRIMEYIRRHAVHNTIIGLMAARGKEPFYQGYGFTPRPNETLGAGMTIFWKEGELP
jgi:GNAT superfamily N-acetyltransferase